MVQQFNATKKDRLLTLGSTDEDRVVKYCRRIFKGKYNQHWIDTLEKHHAYCMANFLPEIRVELYPKLTDLRAALKQLGITPPAPFRVKKPKKPTKNRYKKEENYQKAFEKYKAKLAEYNQAKLVNDIEWSKYRSIVYGIVHRDINEQKRRGIKPIRILIKSIRIVKEKNENTHNKNDSSNNNSYDKNKKNTKNSKKTNNKKGKNNKKIIYYEHIVLEE